MVIKLVADAQGACCDIWASSRSSNGERYPSLQGRGPQISDMSALRWEDSQSAATSVDGEEPASEHAEVWPASRPWSPQLMTLPCQASVGTSSARQHTSSSELL